MEATHSFPKMLSSWLKLTIEVKVPSAGYLRFEQKRGDSNRGDGRRRVKLGNAKTWLERRGEPIGVDWGLQFRHECSFGD